MSQPDSELKDPLWRNVSKRELEAEATPTGGEPEPTPVAATGPDSSPASKDPSPTASSPSAVAVEPVPDVPTPAQLKARRRRAGSKSADGTNKQAPPIPLAVKLFGVGVLVVLLVMAAWFGSSLARQPEPELWPLSAPVQLGEYVAAGSEEETSPDGALNLVRASYSDGTSKFVLILSRPSVSSESLPSVETLLADNGVTGATVVGESSCGVAADNDLPLCLRVVDSTAILVAGLTGQEHQQLSELVDTMYEALRTG